MATTLLYRKLSMVTENDKKEPIMVWWGPLTGGMNTVGYKGMSSHHAMLSKQCVLYLGVRVKQAVSLVGEDLCEACKQSNKTIASDDVT